jgi:photosystem II PsbU protein
MMLRNVFSVFLGLVLLIGSWIGLGFNQSAVAQTVLHSTVQSTHPLAEVLRNPVDKKLGEVGSKVDLNNSNVMTFRKYPGLYPTLARKIIRNAPFDTVEDVLDIPGLSDRELDLLKANLDNFVVTPTEPALTEGADRFNPGIYK